MMPENELEIARIATSVPSGAGLAAVKAGLDAAIENLAATRKTLENMGSIPLVLAIDQAIAVFKAMIEQCYSIEWSSKSDSKTEVNMYQTGDENED